MKGRDEILELLKTEEDAISAAKKIGFPIILKATAGGGRMGLFMCQNDEQTSDAFAKVKSRGEKLFKNFGVFLQKYFPQSRHVEVQVFGNGTSVLEFGERMRYPETTSESY